MSDLYVFKRYEKKYLISTAQHRALVKAISPAMTADEFGLHAICNLYFDTDGFDLIRTSIEKPVYKEKLRLRSYGVPGPDDRVFLEIKKKFKKIVYKRRAPLTLRELEGYLAYGLHPAGGGQVMREIDWFMARYRPYPRAYIAYDRIAYLGSSDPNLRITFDHDIRFRASQLDLARGDWGSPVLQKDQVLMEIKIPGSMPLWLNHILTDLAIFPTSFSKYGTCYQKFLIREGSDSLCLTAS
ncbi:polyphosphate polymerase domain-containing protein [Gehongia tenuis]|uniref:Polyphosphate polymerase domain-containing protein n=1 Tax=Gehongia tenuis TaxID=2763655 RepID=A0A926D3X8_9FIRM|nr:polyphosphate polymerase domain-containing protein [Gehongia tenuis]MBC8530892.1 polyphosphate polymerase domain-containing protein [Gehongia tenuis]